MAVKRADADQIQSAGFTLIEVVIAILILASSLVVLLGLQSSATQKAIRDKQQQQAMLLARTILAAIEADSDSIEKQETSGTASKLIENLKGPPFDKLPQEITRIANLFKATLRVDQFEIPPFNPESLPIPMKRVTLRVFWSDLPEDSLQVVYTMPEEKKDEAPQ